MRFPLIVPVQKGMRPAETVQAWARRHEVFCVLDTDDQATRKAWEKIPGVLLYHAVPLGLGRSIKTGLNAVLARGGVPWGVMVLRGEAQEAMLSEAFVQMREDPRCVCVGQAQTGDLQSRAFAALTGIVGGKSRAVSMDVGWLGIPAALSEKAVTCPGEGDAYLTDLLLNLKKEGIKLRLWEETHKPDAALRVTGIDWLRMGIAAAAFVLSSLTSFLIDYGLFALLLALGLSRNVSTVIARILSSMVNFTLNRSVVFHSAGRKGNLGKEIAQYYALVALMLVLNILILGLFNEILGIPVMLAKLATEGILFVCNYFVQRDLIFREGRKNRYNPVKKG